MSTLVEQYAGDDWAVPVELYDEDGEQWDVSTATIQAALVKVVGDTPTLLIAATAQSSGATGAVWAQGKVVVEFTNTLTGAVVDYGTHQVEVEVTISLKKTTKRFPVKVINKAIS